MIGYARGGQSISVTFRRVGVRRACESSRVYIVIRTYACVCIYV